MVRACENGQRVGLDQERSALADQYYPMAAAMSRPYRLAWPRARDEFESAAGMALVLAADRYEFDRNVPFPLYAARWITGALRDVQRDLEHRHGRGETFDPESGSDWDTDPTATVGSRRGSKQSPRNPCDWPRGDLDRVLDNHDPTPEIDKVDAFEARIVDLPAPLARVCRALFLHGLTVSETARALGITQPRVTQLRNQALKRLRRGNGRAPKRFRQPPQERPWPIDSARTKEAPSKSTSTRNAGNRPERPARDEPAAPTLTHLGSECPCSF